MSGIREVSGVMGVQAVVISGRTGHGGDADSGLGCGTGGGAGGYRLKGDGNGQIISERIL